MPRFSKSFLFPDVNVWVALTYAGHIHHTKARSWFDDLDIDARVGFCRFTQISLLRLLTTQAVMGVDDVMSQADAWETYDRWCEDARVVFLEEPTGLEESFRSLSRQSSPNPKNWADSYLAAFATVSQMQLVTFDQGFRGKILNLHVLRP